MERFLQTPEVGEGEQKNVKEKLQFIIQKSLTEGIKKAEKTEYKAEASDQLSEEIIIDRVLDFFPKLGEAKSLEPGKKILLSRELDGSTFELFRKEILAGKILINETVVKQKKSGEPNKTKVRGAILKIDNDHGGELCLNDILPYECSFYPLGPTVPDLLDQYDGLDEKEGENNYFSLHIQNEQYHKSKVIYGNITDNSGVLSLLHEVVHSWQHVYHPETLTSSDMVKKIIEAAIDHSILLGCRNMLEQTGTLNEEYLEYVKSKYDTEGKNLEGVIATKFIKISAFLGANGLRVDRGNLVDKDEDGFFKTKIAEYVWTERHAWSTALKLFRVLENEALLPEDVDQNTLLEDIDKRLNTYQSDLDALEHFGIKIDKGFNSHPSSAQHIV